MKKNPRSLRHLGTAALLAACALAATPGLAAPPPGRVPDTIEQRVAACIACHGREGSSTEAGYFPRLSGKPAAYLFNQLQSFRDGRRLNSDMTHMVRHMSDAYLHEIADYFASIQLPYPAPPRTTDATPEMLARGKALVFEGDPGRNIPACVRCHGEALTGVLPGIPALVGLPRLYLSSQLGAWLTDDRHALAPDCMTEVGRKLTAADINAVASWLAMQPVPADPKPIAAPPSPVPMACSALNN
ncbi:cytochrome c4 [Variovorax ureilyticus]|uniref:Cytochrome c4 n=1 Tax=Variovorax ureilyticus TaxID=1836198 RepID=A0ABU8VBY7_9BURK